MNTVQVGAVTTSLVKYGGTPVCTTRQLADLYGCLEKHITDNHQNNEIRFEEGKHFIKLEGEALKSFKRDIPDNFGYVGKRSARLILWTERGAARHAKMLSTDRAWDVFEQLEDVYFNSRAVASREVPQPAKQRLTLDLMFAEASARVLNLPQSGKLLLLQRIENVYALTPMLPFYAVDEGTGSTGSSRVAHSATELLRAHGAGVSASKFNQALSEIGILAQQERASTKTPSKRKRFWSVTESGMRYGKNSISPANPKETHPEWFDDTFSDLLGLVRERLRIAA